ncbi:hypothetical protein AVEN_94191-1 [Araneus ventricosus]|uniref:Uncharacterized protein n=1 Tax=Araneus ventricosus TaxID=182803 RepID=A0A4Y2R9C7_ARAVE|nr:hypothetical protein AVEN_195204-1 [Araneus ventricosus]GBN72386.1 hypothetical protein AVEN_94191-1 [Araneus ventricosus]
MGEPSSSHRSSSGSARVNQICRCINRNVEDDNKPCLKCLSKLAATAPVAQSGGEALEIANITSIGSQLVALGLQLLDAARLSETFNGFRPPSTPSTLIRESTEGEAFSTPEVGITSLNDETSMVLDLSKQINSDEFVHK